MSEVTFNWHGDDVKRTIRAEMGRRVNRAGRFLRDQIRVAISRPNALFVTARRGKRAGQRVVVGKSRGKDPSGAGEYPKKLLGHLRRNIQTEYDAERLIARVGTNVIYGKYLQTGTRRMAPRPWMSLALRHQRAGLIGILSKPM